MTHMNIQLAAINPEKRDYYIFRALSRYKMLMKTIGVALIRYSPHYDNAYKFIYYGPDQVQMENWFQRQIAPSIDLTLVNLMKAHSSSTSVKPELFPYENGILVVWNDKKINPFDNYHKILMDYLEALSYVEKMERLYFYDIKEPFESELSQLIKHKDEGGINELLSLSKTISHSDFVFWGNTNSDHIEVATHLGSLDNQFGFQLPIEEGMGGYTVQHNSLLQVKDYKNSEYRYQEVSKAVDEEKLHTVLALPVNDNEANVSGVLYLSNRDIKPFSIKTKLMLLRLGRSIEPLTKYKKIKQFFMEDPLSKIIREKKNDLRNVIQYAKELSELEVWLEELIKGKVMIVDEKGLQSYGQSKEAIEKNHHQPFVFPIETNQHKYSKLLIWTDMKEVPPKGWPDLIDDVISAIHIILEREERVSRAIQLEHSQLINGILNNSSDLNVYYKKAIQLRVPVDSGVIWAIHWNLDDKVLTSEKRRRLKEIVLNRTKNPLIYTKEIGFILANKPLTCEPEELRNQLLKEFSTETWVVHGITYTSFQELQNKLKQLDLLIKRIKMFKEKTYVLELNDFGLDNLLTNPTLTHTFNDFAIKTLSPIIEYDQKNNTQFTKTLALSLVYQSPSRVAEKLYIHANTVHYRVNRAKELLNLDLNKPGNDIALKLAAYTWLYNETSTLD